MREKQLLQRNNNSCQVTGKEIAGDMREKQLLQRNNNSCQVPANLVVVARLFCCSGAPQANCIQENLKESKLFLYNFECVFFSKAT